MDFDRLCDLVKEPEDDHHDFKQQWYHKGQKDEMVKDIFSFVNTTHRDDCYLIIGETDDYNIVGVENDCNRLTQQKLISYFDCLPISGGIIPDLKINTFNYKGHELDVIIIPNTFDVPVYLKKKWTEKGTKNVVYPGQIFMRHEDGNTSKIETAEYPQVERLWRKHFRLDSKIDERYSYVLSDISAWSYNEINIWEYRYDVDPSFYMELENVDTIAMRSYDSYSIDQLDPQIGWFTLKLKYNNQVINELNLNSIDGTRGMIVVPDSCIVDDVSLLSFKYFLKDSLKSKVQNLLKYGSTTREDNYSLSKFEESIAYFENSAQKDEIVEILKKNKNQILERIEPNEGEVSDVLERVQGIFSFSDRKITKEEVEITIRQKNLGKIVNAYLNRIGNCKSE